jgi:hypothetical protein
VVHAEISNVCVGEWLTCCVIAVTATTRDCCLAGIFDINIGQGVPVIGSCCTVTSESDTEPIITIFTFNGNVIGVISNDLYLSAGSVNGDTLAVSNLEYHAWLDCNSILEGEIISISRIDTNR